MKKKYEIFYWSFYLGHPKSKRTEWIYRDLKIPACNIREAIFHEFVMMRYHFREFNNDYSRYKNVPYEMPSQAYVWLHIRRVVQYQRLYTPERGYTVHQYKKIAEYSVHSYLNLFNE